MEISLPENKKILIASIAATILTLLLCIGGATFFYLHTAPKEKVEGQQINLTPTPTPTTAMPYNFLNGMYMSKDDYTKLSVNRPLAVMIPNDTSARFQYGVNKADVVYEALTEGPITRFMAIFWSHQEDFRIMPIRSIRAYFLNWLLEYNDIIVMHSGYAQTDDPRTNAYAILKDYNVKTLIWDWPLVYDTDCLNAGLRPGYNCARSSSQTLWNAANKKGWTGATWGGLSTSQQWPFKSDATAADRGTIKEIKVPFLYPDDASTVYWKYNPDTNMYLRYDQDHKPFIDMLDNSQIYTKTLVVQEIDYAPTGDAKHRSIQDAVGTGKASIFEDGKVYDAIWKKNSITDRTRFYDPITGQEIPFNRGRIWIAVIPNTQSPTYQ